MKWVVIGVLVILGLTGCATKTEYVDRPVEVKVPIKCELPMPVRPKNPVGVDGLREVLGYTEMLECTLLQCRGEVCK